MEFCSQYGYNYGYEGSSDEEDDAASAADTGLKSSRNRKFNVRKADTNVIGVKFDDLILPVEMYDSKLVVQCDHCGAILSHISETHIETIFDKLLWQCEFCLKQNDVTERLKSVHNVPKTDCITYLNEEETLEMNVERMWPKLEEDFNNASYLVFCIDVSGSMCTMIPVRREQNEASVDGGKKTSLDMSFSSDCADPVGMTNQSAESSASLIHLSDDDDDEHEANISNIVNENDIVIQAATASDVDMVSDEEKKLDDEIKVIENKLQDNEVNDKDQLTRHLDELKLKRQMLEEQRTFFEDSLRQQDECRTRDFQTHFSLYSIDDRLHEDKGAATNEPTISRLAGVKMACIDSLDHLKQNGTNVPVVLVTFSDHVTYYGDSNKSRLVIKDEKDLMNKEKINSFAAELKEKIKPVSESAASLEEIVKLLNAEGGTALGPAIQFSVALASRRPGSQIILCTDGISNMGMGDIENGDIKTAEKFYNSLADYAKTKRVVVNVITMEGTDCKLAILGHVADRTNGSMYVVNPLNLGVKFKSIIQKRLIGTNVTVKLIVSHKYIYIRDEEFEKKEAALFNSANVESKLSLEKLKKSVVTKEVGNVTIDTEITFEYGMKRQIENSDKFEELPFQLQITYETADGVKAVKVYTKVQQFTKNRDQAEKSLMLKELLFSNASQKISRHVLNSNVLYAKEKAKAQDRLFMQNKIKLPQCYSQTMSMVKNIRDSKRACELDDTEAQMMFLHAKASRAIFKTEPLLEE